MYSAMHYINTIELSYFWHWNNTCFCHVPTCISYFCILNLSLSPYIVPIFPHKMSYIFCQPNPSKNTNLSLRKLCTSCALTVCSAILYLHKHASFPLLCHLLFLQLVCLYYTTTCSHSTLALVMLCTCIYVLFLKCVCPLGYLAIKWLP